jgi:hypothetical protein
MSDPKWVPVREVVTGGKGELQLLQQIAAAGGPGLGDPKSQEYLNRLQRLRRIGEYKFPIEIFRSEDYGEVTELFVRINSAGTRLRAAELVLAQLALRLPGAIAKMFEEAMDEYEKVGYDLDTRFLMRALIAVGTGQSRFRYLTEFWKRRASEVNDIWLLARKGSTVRSIVFAKTPASSHPAGCRRKMRSFLWRLTLLSTLRLRRTSKVDCCDGSTSLLSAAGTAVAARLRWTRTSKQSQQTILSLS